MVVKLCYGQQEAKVTLLVVYGKGPSLLGWDWLQSLQLNWHRKFIVYTEVHS